MKFTFALLLSLASVRAFAFPENTRHGYPSCAACHVSPTGGGVLTPYGRGASEAFMTTWSFEGEAEPDYGYLGIPDWLMLGGDQRGVAYTSRGPDGAFPGPTYIPMELSGELAVYSPWAPNVVLDVQAGIYGPDRTLEYRRYYLKAMLSPNVGVRAGRFLPAYGVNTPDHTTITRSALGLGEGAESYNGEAFWLAPKGEVFVDAVFGQSSQAYLDSPQRVGTLRTDDYVGGTGRAAVYTDSRSSAGISAMSLRSFAGGKRDAVGVFAQQGLSDKAYLLTEADRLWERGSPAANLSMAKLGYEVVPGLLPYVMGEQLATHSSGRVGAQWLPRPHWEVSAELRVADQDGFGGLPKNSLVGLLHHWM